MLKRYFVPLCLAFMLLLGLCACSPALAADKEEVEYEYIGYYTKSDAILAVQEQLIKLYYLDEKSDFTLQLFDEATYHALEDFCNDKHLDYMLEDMVKAQALTPELQKYILERSPAPKPSPETPAPSPTPSPTPFPTLRNGDSGAAVNDVQAALSRLKYFENVDGKYRAGVLDDVTEEALRQFCDVIGMEYNPYDGLTSYLYGRVMATDAPTAPAPTATPLKFLYIYSRSDDVREAQNRLNELDYFRNKTPEWGYYDDVTSEAVTKFCEVNNVPTFANGMDETIINKLYSEDAKANPAERTTLRRGEDGDTVRELQARLFTLGYYTNRTRTNKVDDDMLDAVADFASVNHYSFDNQTLIPLDIQDGILSSSALAYTEAETESENWLTASISFMGMDMPRYLVILLGAVIVAGLVFLLIHAFGSGKKKEGGANDSWNDDDHQAPRGSAPRLELSIQYEGVNRTVTVDMEKPLRIGRAEKTLPLSPKDTDISRRHCQMYFRGDALLLRDYSSNGTMVNDQKYNNCECVVRDYDTICVGKHTIGVRILK